MKTYDAKMINKLFFRLLPIQILITVISSLNGIIDATVAGKFIGPDALAVIGLFAPVSKLVETINVVLLGGSQILCGRFLGRNQLDRTRSVFSLDMVAMAAAGLAVMTVCLLFPAPLASLLGASDNLRQGLIRYTMGCAPGLPAMMAAAQLSAFLQLEQQEKRTYFGIVLMAVGNLAMDVLFVNVFDMGMLGLGLATSAANWIFFLIQASFYFTGKAQIRLELRSIDLRDLKSIGLIGMPGAVGSMTQVLRGVVIAHVMTKYVGDAGMSAYAAAGSFGGINLSVAIGIAAAIRLLASVYIGEEDRASLRIIMKTSLTKGLALAAAVDIVMMALAVPITGIFYTPDAGIVYDYAVAAFRVFPLSLIMSCLYLVFQNYYQCFGKMKITTFLSAVDGFFGMGVPALIMVPFLGINGIWSAQILNGFICMLVVWIYTAVCNRRLPHTLDDYLLIPEDFGLGEGDRLDISIHSIEDAINTAERVSAFCSLHDVDAKRTNFASLCAEELTGNVVRHGFVGGEKHSVDVRVLYKNGDITIRLKDDCRPFNPKDVDALFNPEDPLHNIGLRLTKRIAKDMSYQNTLGLNVLTIVI